MENLSALQSEGGARYDVGRVRFSNKSAHKGPGPAPRSFFLTHSPGLSTAGTSVAQANISLGYALLCRISDARLT